jgi:multimeric flavodoxin WrbA
MKVTTIMGSPRKKGNTAKVLGLLEELLAQGHEVDRIDMVDFQVKGCMGCAACKKITDQPGCVQKDEAGALFERIMDSDILIYASPLYSWGFTSQMKAFLDRHFCLVTGYGGPDYKSLIAGKRLALLVTCDGPIENNADLIQVAFDRIGDYLRCDVVGKYIIPFSSTPDALKDKAIEVARQMAKDIVGV